MPLYKLLLITCSVSFVLSFLLSFLVSRLLARPFLKRLSLKSAKAIKQGETFRNVAEFHCKFGALVSSSPKLLPSLIVDLRYNLMQEELYEYRDAAEIGDLIGIADAIADVIYVAYGTAVSHGIPIDSVLTEVHRSNMSKLGCDGKPIYRADGKVLKGPNYSPPDIKNILLDVKP